MAELTLTGFFKLPTGAKYFTRKDDRVYHSIEGALSFGFYDRAVSAGVNRVNDLSASVLGRPWFIDAVTTVTAGVVSGSSGVTSVVTKTPGVAAVYDAPESFDYRLTGNPPVDEPETHTLILFMSGNEGTGNVIAMVPFHLFEQFSPSIPVRY